MRKSCVACLWAMAAISPVDAAPLEVKLVELEPLSADYAVSRIEHSLRHGLLFLMDETKALCVVDLSTRSEIDRHTATEQFTDMDLTADGSFLFVADFGGETSYGAPIRPHFVHRYDLDRREWKVAKAPKIAHKIEAVSADRVLLLAQDQWVDMTLNRFGDSMEELSRIRAGFFGDFEYDPKTGRVYHGNSRLSSCEVHVMRLAGDELLSMEDTDSYGTAREGGGTCVLSTDGSRLYYGPLQINALDIRHNLHFFPEVIWAASADIAFGPQKYYYAKTGAELGTLGFATSVYGLGEEGKDLWAFHPAGKKVHHYGIGPSAEHRLVDLSVHGPSGLGFASEGQLTAIAIYEDGSRTDVTSSARWDISPGNSGAIHGSGLLTTFNVEGDIVVQATYVEGKTVSATKTVGCIQSYGEKGVLDVEYFGTGARPVQMEYAPKHGLLFLRIGQHSIQVVDVRSRNIVETRHASDHFTDMDLTADSKLLFVADFKGESDYRYISPPRPHFVHRYDLQSGEWKMARASRNARKIEAVAGDRILLLEGVQWAGITLNSFGESMQDLSIIVAGYCGDVEFDPKTGRVYHGSSASNSREVNVTGLIGDKLVTVEGTGIYGTAQGGGGTCVLSTDGSSLYYGKLQVDALDVKKNLHLYPESIHAASPGFAFGESRYFDARTGELLSGLGFPTTVYAVSENGKHLWAYELRAELLHHYSIHNPGDQVAFLRGDSTADGKVDIADPIYLLNYLFRGGPPPACETASDADENGKLEATDPLYIVSYYFLHGPAPGAPFPECGPDAAANGGLECQSFPACE